MSGGAREQTANLESDNGVEFPCGCRVDVNGPDEHGRESVTLQHCADARLNAAAPAMLAALRSILYEFDANDDNTISLTATDGARAAIKAAQEARS